MTTEERLGKVERELSDARRFNRWLLLAMMACAGGGIAYWVTQPKAAVAQVAAAPKELRANRIVLEDANGKLCAVLSPARVGMGVTMSDENGKARFRWVMNDTVGTSFMVYDKNEKQRMSFVESDDRTWISLCDSGEQATTLRLSEDGASLGMRAKNKVKGLQDTDRDDDISLFASNKYGAGLDVRAENHTRIRVAVRKDGASIGVRDEQGTERCTIGASQTGTPDGKVTTYPESTLMLFSPNSKVLWQAP